MRTKGLDARDSGFTLFELLIVLTVIGILSSVGVTAYSSYREHTLKVEADSAWEELSMAVNLFRMKNGDWPAKYTHALNVGHVTGAWGALAVNLAPGDHPDAGSQSMVGAPQTGGPTAVDSTGHIVLANGELCVWVEGYASTLNDASCPTGSM